MSALLSPDLIGVPPPGQPVPSTRTRVPRVPRPSQGLGGPMLVISVDPTVTDGALHVAQLLARRDRVNAHILAIVPPFSGYAPFLTGVDYQALDEGRRHTQLSALRRHVHRTVGRPVHFSTGAEIGHTLDAIGRVAHARRSALVLSGLELKGTARRASTEQLALRAMTAAGVPVLAVPLETALLPQRTLVAVDFKAASIRAAHAALATASPGGTVTLVHVAGPGEGHSDSAHNGFDRLLPSLRAPSTINLETFILEGDPTTALRQFASAGRYDLLAVGSRATARSDFRLAGGVCLGLLRSAMGAVLIAPPLPRDTDLSSSGSA